MAVRSSTCTCEKVARSTRATLPKEAAVVVRHEVAVAARREAAMEALEVGVRGGQVEHLHLREGREVDARHLAEGGAVVVRHEVAVAARREAAAEALEVGVRGGQVEHLDVRVRGPAWVVREGWKGGQGNEREREVVISIFLLLQVGINAPPMTPD